MIQLNLHGIFLQYELGEHNWEQITQMKFTKQRHLGETEAETVNQYQSYQMMRVEDAPKLQNLEWGKYKSPLLGSSQQYAEGHPWSKQVRNNADDLCFKLHCTHALIICQTGILLPQYAKTAFCDAAYTPVVEALRRLRVIPDASQVLKLESRHCFWNLSSDRWKKQASVIQISGLITHFDFTFDHDLEEPEQTANERHGQEDAASELVAWARISQRILHQENGENLWKQWNQQEKDPRKVKPLSLAQLINDTRQFDGTF